MIHIHMYSYGQVVALVSVWRVLRGAQEAGLRGHGWVSGVAQENVLGFSMENDGKNEVFMGFIIIHHDLSMEIGVFLNKE